METITSRNNRLIVEYAKLKNKKYRDERSLFFFEGIKLYKEAIRCQVPIVCVFYHESVTDLADLLPSNIPKYAVTSSVYEKLTDENSPQGIFCVAKHLDNLHKFATIYKDENFIDTASHFLIEGIRDPGNLGTILRSASAMDLDILILSADCADIYNPKTVRAGMGAVFRQKTVRVADCIQAVHYLQNHGSEVYAAVLNSESADVRHIRHDNQRICFAVGNEGHGLSDDLVNECSGSVIIPMNENCESLNAATAASILLWERYRNQKSSAL